jgi:hypothetical protein
MSSGQYYLKLKAKVYCMEEEEGNKRSLLPLKNWLHPPPTLPPPPAF